MATGGMRITRGPNRSRMSRKSTGTIRDDRKLICDSDLCLMITSHVSLTICKSEPDSTGSNGIAADEVVGAKGSDAKSQPAIFHLRRAVSAANAPPPTWTVPATDSRVFPLHRPVAEQLEQADLPFVSSARFEGVRRLA